VFRGASTDVRILQLTSDWKWTGPAAPMLQLLLALRERGHEVDLVCARAPGGLEPSLADQARVAGAAPVLELARARGLRWRRDAPDVEQLRALMESRGFDLVHTWHTRDHFLALRATHRRRRAGLTRVVRSYKSAEPISAAPWNRWLFGPACDGLVCVSPRVAEANRRLRGGRPVLGAFGAVDLERFRPAAPDKAVRESLGLEPGQPVVGIVARAQRHRRFDLLMQAAGTLLRRLPAARLLVIGRGTHIRETAHAPAIRLGIADRVIFAGYRTTDYVDVLRNIDIFTFLVPGSDGGCRALLEAAACGIPAVTTARGALSELVLEGETGCIVPERAEALAAAWYDLLVDGSRRAAMGAAARRRAETHFAPERLSGEILALYTDVLRGVR
jgi:glycosyltransferase involved in cell wall biosynthesis